jgi:hypothetical protein
LLWIRLGLRLEIKAEYCQKGDIEILIPHRLNLDSKDSAKISMPSA